MRIAWDAWWTTWRTGFAVVETLGASAQVIAARTTLIGAAIADPKKGDWAELGRMVPEKVSTLGEVGQAAALDVARLHADALRLWSGMAALAVSGRPPSLAQAGALLSQMAAGQSDAMGAGGRALAPVRRRVMGNVRRLRR